jgi:rhodanese-related sulfurtransferase
MQQFAEFFANHPLLFTALALVLLALVANEVHGHLTGGKRLGALEAVRLINDRDPIIVDLRPAADYKRGHLLNAQHVPLNKLGAIVGQWSKDRPILLYCALGSTATVAADQLRKNGFAEVYPIRGGLNAWLGASLPVTAK